MHEKFTSEVKKCHTHQKFKVRVTKLEKDLWLYGPKPCLVRVYNKLDDDLILSIKATAARSVWRKQHGYHQSPALIEAST